MSSGDDERARKAWPETCTEEASGLTDQEVADLGLDRVLEAAEQAERVEVAFLDQLADLAEAEWFRREGASSLTGWLRRRLDLDSGDAIRLARRVNLLVQLPEFRSALVNEQTSLQHLKVLDRHATSDRRRYCARFTEQLVGYATNLGVDDYNTVCARWADLIDNELEPHQPPEGSLSVAPTLFGQAHISGRLTADQAEPVLKALQSLVAPQPKDAPVKRTYRERLADALADLAQIHLAPDGEPSPAAPAHHAGNARARSTTTVVIDLDTLTSRQPVLWAGTDREQPALDQVRIANGSGQALPSSVAELLMCDTNIQRLVVDSQGRPVDLGRRTRIVTGAQRAALQLRDGGCVFPTCDRPARFCDAHHLVGWADGGPTDLENLVLLCRHHHRLVHGASWEIERDRISATVTARRSDSGWSVSYRRNVAGGIDVERMPARICCADP